MQTTTICLAHKLKTLRDESIHAVHYLREKLNWKS